MYDLKDLPTFIFLVKGVRPDVFNNWEALLSDEIQRRRRIKDGLAEEGERLSQPLRVNRQTSMSDFSDSLESDVFLGARASHSQSSGVHDDSLSLSDVNDEGAGTDASPMSMSIRWPDTNIAPAAPMQLQVNVEPLPRATTGPTSLPEFLRLQLQEPNRPCVFERHVPSLTQQQVVSLAINAGKLAVKLTDEKKVLKHQLKMQQQVVRRVKDRLAKSKDAIKSKADTEQDTLHVEKRGSRLTFRGSVALGVRKAMGLVSAASFPLTSLVDSSRWTVTRAEVHCWALLIARSRAFYATLLSLLSYVNMQHQQYDNDVGDNAPNCDAIVESDGMRARVLDASNRFLSQSEAVSMDCKLPVPTSLEQKDIFSAFTVGSTLFSGDATNANIWQRQKLQGLETCTTVLVNADAFVKGDLDSAFVKFHQMYLSLWLQTLMFFFDVLSMYFDHLATQLNWLN